MPARTVEELSLRAEARALLCGYGLDVKPDAVDDLWSDAEESGLVRELGVDAVQSLLADAFNRS